jgi:hypothetical protein
MDRVYRAPAAVVNARLGKRTSAISDAATRSSAARMQDTRHVVLARLTREALGAVRQPSALLDEPPVRIEDDHRIARAP